MAEAKPENEIEDDQCPVGKIIHKWVRDKQEECLTKVGHDKERFREKLEEKSSITIACLGGGPGSDVLGVLDYFRDFEGQLNIQLYDRKNKWDPCWVSLRAAIDEELHDPRVTVSFHDFDVTTADKNKPDIQDADPKLKVTVSFHDFDVTTADKNKPDIQDADVITMHYFMEEVYSEREKEEVKECFDHIIQTAKPGALFLYSGMYMYQATDWVHRLLKDNCKVDLRQEGDLKLFYDIRDNLETGGYPVKEISFRLDGNVVYRLYQKK
ncbi:hypothetical protein Bbelb_000370 [Branchiostoma belcheri]|nr:hypothetical protein Bbelb_000370 [Branchiostoma belcheri]